MCKGQRERCPNSLHLLNELYTAHWIRLPLSAKKWEYTLPNSSEGSEYEMRQEAISSRSYWAARGSVFLLAFISKKHKKCALRKIPFLTTLSFLYFFSVITGHHMFASPPIFLWCCLPMTLALAEQSFNRRLHFHSAEAMTVSKKNLIAFFLNSKDSP